MAAESARMNASRPVGLALACLVALLGAAGLPQYADGSRQSDLRTARNRAAAARRADGGRPGRAAALRRFDQPAARRARSGDHAGTPSGLRFARRILSVRQPAAA